MMLMKAAFALGLLAAAHQSAAFTLPSSSSSKVPTFLMSTVSSDNGIVVVVSPPGGVGEVAAVKAASNGSTVRWLVVADDESKTNIQLAPTTLKQIGESGGKLDLASSTVEELLQTGDESSLQALSTWCSASGTPNGLICTYDGCGSNSEYGDEADTYQAGIRLATQQASANLNGPAVAILAADQDLDNLDGSSGNDNDEESGGGGIFGMFKSKTEIASTLVQAVPSASSSATTILRHGELFGIPESNPNFSPLVGGPKRTPIIAEEYTMRDVRIDPFVFSGNIMASVKSSKSNRHSIGTIAALFATKQLSPLKAVANGILPSISVTSQPGMEEFTTQNYQDEIERVQQQLASNPQGSMILYKSQDMIVTNIERLTNWLATKWAPAVLKTYDLATIRSGARPVYALSSGEEGNNVVEIVWQELVNFESVNVGKMILNVSKDGVTATRAAGDPTKGYGTVSMKPLPGEDVLVRRLSEAASQAMDKGLAKKIKTAAPSKAAAPKPAVRTSIQSSGTVESSATAAAVAAPAAPPTPSEPETGPRKAGARRSTPRKRGGGSSSSAPTDEE